MSTRASFLDTNVLLYLLSADASKADRASQLLAMNCFVSIQVLSEFTKIARHKLKLDWRTIDEFIDTMRTLCSVEPLTMDTYRGARVLAERYGMSWYDALIAASAASVGCSTLYSEDFQHGLLIDRKLRVINPFL